METNREAQLVRMSAAVIAAVLVMEFLTACSSGGYVQLGWIPVTQVDDHHGHDANKPETKRY
jgi:hypothetical protein